MTDQAKCVEVVEASEAVPKLDVWVLLNAQKDGRWVLPTAGTFPSQVEARDFLRRRRETGSSFDLTHARIVHIADKEAS